MYNVFEILIARVNNRLMKTPLSLDTVPTRTYGHYILIGLLSYVLYTVLYSILTYCS